MLTTIRESWGWTGLDPAAVTATNAFGNVLVRAADGAYWRICPEELSCKVVAGNDAEFDALLGSEEFQIDWQMTRLVRIAQTALAPVAEDRCYCLKIPAVLGGKYDAANFGTISRRELIAFAGDIAEQIKHLPDGANVKFTFTE